MSLALRAHGLWKSFAAGVDGCSARAWVLRGATLEVHRGECVVVLGAPRAGTTTLIHCLAGLRRTDAGSVETAMEPLLVDAASFHELRGRTGRLLLVDDELCPRGNPRARFVHEPNGASATAIIATHELARVRDIADRVVLLHHGRLVPLDRLTGARRVAEPAVQPTSDPTNQLTPSDRHAPARPETAPS